MEKLRRKQQFQHVRLNGRKVRVNSWLLVFYLNNCENCLRCGWTIPKYVGNAVLRNRLKRWCREFFKEKDKKEFISLDINVVFLKYDKIFFKTLKYQEIQKVLDKSWSFCRKNATVSCSHSVRGVSDNNRYTLRRGV